MHTFRFRSLDDPPGAPYTVTSVEDDEYVWGWNAGAGVNFSVNQIIGFGGQFTFHGLQHEALEDQYSVTFGLNVKIP